MLSGIAEQTERNLNFLHAPDGQNFIRSGPDIASLERLDRFVWLSLEASLPPFRVERAKRWQSGFEPGEDGRWRSVSGWGTVRVPVPNEADSVSKELALLASAFRNAATLLDLSCPSAAQLRYAPHIQLLIQTLRSHALSKFLNTKLNEQLDRSGRIVAELYNDFVAAFRQSMLKRKLLRREMHNWRLGSIENEANLRAYLDDRFAQHECLTVLHLRLFHARERANLIASAQEARTRDLGALRESRTRFFDRMRRKPSLFTDSPGRVWSIIPSLEGGHELHITLLFDSVALQKTIDDYTVASEQAGQPPMSYADRIGKYWVETATRGAGDYRSVDRDDWLYGGNWVHGDVRRDDVRRREKLTETLGYLAMRRALVRLRCEPPGEYFGMSARATRASRRANMGTVAPA